MFSRSVESKTNELPFLVFGSIPEEYRISQLEDAYEARRIRSLSFQGAILGGVACLATIAPEQDWSDQPIKGIAAALAAGTMFATAGHLLAEWRQQHGSIKTRSLRQFLDFTEGSE